MKTRRIVALGPILLVACNTFASVDGDADVGTDQTQRDVTTDPSSDSLPSNDTRTPDQSFDLADLGQDVTDDAGIVYNPLCPGVAISENRMPFDTNPAGDGREFANRFAMSPDTLSLSFYRVARTMWITYRDPVFPDLRYDYVDFGTGPTMFNESAVPLNWSNTAQPLAITSHKLAPGNYAIVETGEFQSNAGRAVGFSGLELPGEPPMRPAGFVEKQLFDGQPGDYGFSPRIVGGTGPGTVRNYWVVMGVDQTGVQSIGRARHDETELETFSLPNDTFLATDTMIGTHGSDAFLWNRSDAELRRLVLEDGDATRETTGVTSQLLPGIAYLGAICNAEVYAVASSDDPSNGYRVSTYPYDRSPYDVIATDVTHLQAQPLLPNTLPDTYNTVVVANFEQSEPNFFEPAVAVRIFSVGRNSVDLVACRRFPAMVMDMPSIDSLHLDVSVESSDTIRASLMWRNRLNNDLVFVEIDFPGLNGSRVELLDRAYTDCEFAL